MRRLSGLFPIFFLLTSSGFAVDRVGEAGDGIPGLNKVNEDTDKNYTSIGNIGLTVTNFGTIGSRNAYWPTQPSCEYPRGSRIEHIYQGALWVGAEIKSRDPQRNGQIRVSTGSTDRASTLTGKGYEYTSLSGTSVRQRSTLPESQFYSDSAISHQDFVALYTDTAPRDSSEPDRPNPMGLSVRQESYAWNFPFADFFVILNYTLYNTGADTLDSVYVGLWNNGVVRNTNNVQPGRASYFEHGGTGYGDSLRMMYTFDYDGIPTPPAAGSYAGVKLLGTTPFPRGVDSLGNLSARTYFNAWRFRNDAFGFEGEYLSPTDDQASLRYRSRFARLATPLARQFIDPLRARADNMTTLLSAGPFRALKPGDSLNIVYGVICARKFGSQPASLDSREQRSTLYSNAGLAQRAYDGEDTNGDNILNPGEDLNGNGKLDHYQLPQPPRPPKVRAEVENQRVAVYWDKSTSEESIDPISRQRDFEGYRVYRSSPGSDFTNPGDFLLNLPLVGEFDNIDGFGRDTGFRSILLSQPRKFPADTVDYWYRFPPQGFEVSHLNGWQYVYGVAAFDRGDSASGVTSLTSKTELRRVVPGTLPTSQRNKDVGVYPNPYYVNAAWDGSGERTRKIYFYNLPRRCEIRVYTLGGDIVAEMQHDAATYDGSNTEWFRQFAGTQSQVQFAGGEHAWDLVTKFDQAIATGLYLFSVKDADTEDIKTGKILIIK